MEISPRLKTVPDISLIIYNRCFISDLNPFALTERVITFSNLIFWEPFGVLFRVVDLISPMEGT